MKQEDKELLLKDLCARLPYEVKVLNSTYRGPTIRTLLGRISDDEFIMKETYKQVSGEDYRNVRDNVHFTGYIDSIKPYLRPLSSMTSDEKMTLAGICLKYAPSSDVEGMVSELLKFYCYRYLDYNHLIEKGLALEAPEGMYKIK